MPDPRGGPPAKAIRAAGGVVWRPAARAYDGVEVVVIRRDRYGDWTLPKGKLHAGEKHKAAALREVLEETGIACDLGPRLCRTGYPTPLGPKRVKWWAMTPVAGDDAAAGAPPGTPADPEEVSEVVWLPFEDAWERLTYGTDREVLSAFTRRVIARTK